MLTYKSNSCTSNLLLILATIIWGSTFFIIRDNLHSIDAVALTAYRFILAAALLGGFLLLQGKNLFANFKDGIILGLLLAAFYLTQTIGLTYTTAANSGFITSVMILFVPIFNFVLWKKLPHSSQIVAIILSLIGLFLIESCAGAGGGAGGGGNFGAGASAASSASLSSGSIWNALSNLIDWNSWKSNLGSWSNWGKKGDALTLASACFGAIQIIFSDKLMKQDMDPWVMNFQQFLVTGCVSAAAVALFHLPFNLQLYPAKIFFSIAYLAVAASIIAYGILFTAQKHISPINVVIVLMLEPLFAAMFAWTIGKETFIAQQAIGGIFIVVAAIVVSVAQPHR